MPPYRNSSASARKAPQTATLGNFAESTWLGRTLRGFAAQDWLVFAYFVLMLSAVASSQGKNVDRVLQYLVAEMVTYVGGLLIVRGGILREGAVLRNILYRVIMLCPIGASYFQLREILPAVSQRVLDANILDFDLRVFGFEPAVAWDWLVTPATTEWFAFFYFLYFAILIVHMIPMLFVSRDMVRLAHFSLGTLMIFTIGQLTYMVVPGYGPHHHLAGQFHNELSGGHFWQAVVGAVAAGGAQKDIFPSLHTALPTFFTLFSYMHRARAPFKYTWPVMAFISSQIIVATMFLRWHYLIDIVAGVTLATFAAYSSYRITQREIVKRREMDVDPIYSPIERGR